MKHTRHLALMSLVATASIAGALPGTLQAEPGKKAGVNLSPANWGEGEAQRWANIDNIKGKPDRTGNTWAFLQPKVTTGRNGAIAGTTGPAAVHAGMQTLQAGGSAMDAAVATSLTQITLAAGAWVSFAGLTGILYYEAETGKLYEIDGLFGVPLAETDPSSIPARGEASGRTALVPGYFAGMEAGHQRFGKLPFAALFDPAIYYAENGFEVDTALASMLEGRKDVLGRLPATREVFFKEDGTLYAAGDQFKQPKLAATLRQVAKKGAQAHIYNGAWAEAFVAAVQAEGGKITMEDMRRYQAAWLEPLHTTFAGYDVYTTNLPNYGGPMTALGLNLIEQAGILDRPHYAQSAETLADWIKIDKGASMGMYNFFMSNFPAVIAGLGLENFTPDGIATKAVAKNMWPMLKDETLPPDLRGGGGSHSDAIAVVDAQGNIAVLTHTINTGTWGGTGINVEGISIPDAATFQQAPMAMAGPGNHLATPLNPLIVMKQGKPVVAGSSIGSGLMAKTLSFLVNTLGFDMNPREAIDAPALESGNVVSRTQFTAEVIEAAEASGVKMTVGEGKGGRGYYVGLAWDKDTGEIQAASSTDIWGNSEAY